ncbi:hypothetical protein [Microbulbifer sp.]|uniref:hypothetical protein n=1 Tax=Microbulbifer sp. TaxID=1908541 RepID=UPI002585C412|nr:hypothetical protein [Microbulbifer sp.]
MGKAYWVFNVFLLPGFAVYVGYAGVIEGQWKVSLLLLLLTAVSTANYCKAFDEPNVRARENSYQDEYINQALQRIDTLEAELANLKEES